MEINVNLEANAVNEAIAKAVVESRLGAALKERIEKFLDDKSHYGVPNFSDAMKRAVDDELQKIVTQLIHNEYADSIREKVRSQLTDELVSDLVCRAVEKLGDRR